MSELLPCPFCGGRARFERRGTPRASCVVECVDCGVRHESNDEDDHSGESWNTRHTSEGWQMVPAPGTTDEMDDAVRGFLTLPFGARSVTYEEARKHCARYHGPQVLESWPQYALEGEGHIPKAAQADLLYRMLLAAAPKP